MACIKLDILNSEKTCLKWHYSKNFEHSEMGVRVLYFGARYYNSDISVWLSVDPLSDEYPSMSSYMYVAGNPVMLVDPDGMAFRPLNPETEALFKKAGLKIFKNENIYNHFIKVSHGGNFYSKQRNLSKHHFKREIRKINKSLDKNEKVRFSRQEIKNAYSFYKKLDAERLDEIVVLSSKSTNNESKYYKENELTNVSRTGINSEYLNNISDKMQDIENFADELSSKLDVINGIASDIKTGINNALKNEMLNSETNNKGSVTFPDNSILIDVSGGNSEKNVDKLVNELTK